jgi:primosomal protein N' (replication factor Y)
VSEKIPSLCPTCRSIRLREIGKGTEKVERELTSLIKRLREITFPEALLPSSSVRIARLDSTSVRKSRQLADMRDRFERGEIDILVGTQVLLKPWDYSRVGLLGVISIDNLFQLPDFRMNERVMKLITSLRMLIPNADMVLQTYHPENQVLQAFARGNLELFYMREKKMRQQYQYPPFSRLIKLSYVSTSKARALAAGDKIVRALRKTFPAQYHVSDPVLGWPPKIRRKWRIYVMIKIPARAARELLPITCVRNLPGAPWKVEVDPLENL